MPAFRYSSDFRIARAKKWGGCQMNMIKNKTQAAKCKSLSTAAQPISGGIAPEKLPMTVFKVYFRFVHIV